MSMKDAFKKCMLHLYGKNPVDRQQLRDLAHSFSMGWAEALMSVGNKLALQLWVDENIVLGMPAPGWMPDSTWEWWT